MVMSLHEKLHFEILPFSIWRQEIAPLWLMEGSYKWIPPMLNGHGQMQYFGKELSQRVILFPLAASFEGERVAWTSVYNISDEAIRIRGIYVLPEVRSNGIGRALVEHAMSLWPEPWTRCCMYARASNIERYKRWGFVPTPGFTMRTFEQGETFNEEGILPMQKLLRPEAKAEAGLKAIQGAVS
jgi:GNAT superfamily N-acetyltransferase